MRISFLLFLLPCLLLGQIGHWPNDTQGKDKSIYAITNVTLYQSPSERVEQGTLVFSEGKVINAGKIPTPPNAVVIDGTGYFIYPGFIDLFVGEGLRSPSIPVRSSGSIYTPFIESSSAYNDAIRPFVRGYELLQDSESRFDDHMKQGFSVVMAHNPDGIARGTAVLVHTGAGNLGEMLVEEDAAQIFSLQKGSSKMAYPSSLAGSIALLRQLMYDTKWYAADKNRSEINSSLQAMVNSGNLPRIFLTQDKWDITRLHEVSKEFDLPFIYMGSGNEYQRIAEIQATGSSIILPLQFPKPFKDLDMISLDRLSLSQLKHWELAPYNAKMLLDSKIPVAFSLHGLEKKSDFLKSLRTLHENGMTQEQILTALTTTPASLIAQPSLGHLHKGSAANFILTSGDLFHKDTEIYEVYSQGKRNLVKPRPNADLRGEYELEIGDKKYQLSIGGSPSSLKPELKLDSIKGKAELRIEEHKWNMRLLTPIDSVQYSMFALIDNTTKNYNGFATNSRGQNVPFSLKFQKEFESKPERDKKSEKQKVGPVVFPFGAFGNENLPTTGRYILKNATVWTNTPSGIEEGVDVQIHNGKIQGVGKNLSSAGYNVIDATGKHLTNGIIDEHTHIGLTRGVNEVGANNSAEVRMADALNPDDVNFYRQLAGGVIAAQQLHGSANPVGGQSSIVKFHWGQNAANMQFKEAKPAIKFALGENVKQSNWSDNPNRFPQSRAGVEQAFDFWFTRALEYEQEKAKNKNVRKDLRLETMLEILKEHRAISCHSYVQSEINMLMKLAEKFGFTINTFTHILEGYKVADKMKEHGAYASSFSDWWAYKEEVRDAIPHNAALLTAMGVVTAINSDDAEMARRLNQEAAKSVKYGGMSQEEAWKMVTLNPAKMLHVDHITGTIEAGKAADLVLWSHNPLSIYAKAEKTWVDGILYFDLDQQAAKDRKVQEEKVRIMQKMIQSPDFKEGNTASLEQKEEEHYHCDTLIDFH
ncbi:MAG: amidohydrolase family protein [Weeksellaceae bacterium]|nr:amidohydrolase family protein [Weeksellaceae bacterium]